MNKKVRELKQQIAWAEAVVVNYGNGSDKKRLIANLKLELAKSTPIRRVVLKADRIVSRVIAEIRWSFGWQYDSEFDCDGEMKNWYIVIGFFKVYIGTEFERSCSAPSDTGRSHGYRWDLKDLLNKCRWSLGRVQSW